MTTPTPAAPSDGPDIVTGAQINAVLDLARAHHSTGDGQLSLLARSLAVACQSCGIEPEIAVQHFAAILGHPYNLVAIQSIRADPEEVAGPFDERAVRADFDRYWLTAADGVSVCSTAERGYIEARRQSHAELAALRAERDRLKEALKPFAEAAREFEAAIAVDGIDDGLTVLAHIHVMPMREAKLSTADFSNAAKALNPPPADRQTEE